MAAAQGDDDGSNDWTAVMADDGAFRAAAAAQVFDGETEVQALRNIMDGSTSAATRTAALALGHEQKLVAARTRWELWKGKPNASVADAVQKVVTDLDADHLRPSGIEQRLIAGVQPACLGLVTLLQNMQPPPNE